MPPQAVISRIKILAGLNIAERRLPQDGAARIRIGKSEIDARVAIMPTQHGRIRRHPPSLEGAGPAGGRETGILARGTRARFDGCWALPHGMIVVTGPTGSGKTTTLATVLSILNEPTAKILTIEDPVEYEIPGICQSQAKPSVGLTFAAAVACVRASGPRT